MLEQAAQSPVLFADCLQGWRFLTLVSQCLVTMVKEVPELKFRFSLEDAGPFQFELPFHLNPGSLGGEQRKRARVSLKVSSPWAQPFCLPSCLPDASVELPGLTRCRLSPSFIHSRFGQS